MVQACWVASAPEAEERAQTQKLSFPAMLHQHDCHKVVERFIPKAPEGPALGFPFVDALMLCSLLWLCLLWLAEGAGGHTQNLCLTHLMCMVAGAWKRPSSSPPLMRSRHPQGVKEMAVEMQSL